MQQVLAKPGVGLSGEYLILSHFWGGGKPLHCRPLPGIPKSWMLPPLAQWPQTFQVAVEVTRCLGIKYLWIDSPCMIQGDQDDWDTESIKMTQYFHIAAFTIAAKTASSGSEGMFAMRNPLRTFPGRKRLPNASNTDRLRDVYVGVGNEDWLHRGRSTHGAGPYSWIDPSGGVACAPSLRISPEKYLLALFVGGPQ